MDIKIGVTKNDVKIVNECNFEHDTVTDLCEGHDEEKNILSVKGLNLIFAVQRSYIDEKFSEICQILPFSHHVSILSVILLLILQHIFAKLCFVFYLKNEIVKI